MSDKTGIFGQAPDLNLFERLTSLRYILLVANFALFLDLCLTQFYNSSLMKITYSWGEEIPIGAILMVLVGFGFLLTTITPLMRHILTLILIDLRSRVPFGSNKDVLFREKNIVNITEAESWAANNNNSIVADIVREIRRSNRDYYETKNLYFSMFFILFLISKYSTTGSVELIFKGVFQSDYKWVMYLVALAGMIFSSWPARKHMDLMFWKDNPIKDQATVRAGRPTPLPRTVEQHTRS